MGSESGQSFAARSVTAMMLYWAWRAVSESASTFSSYDLAYFQEFMQPVAAGAGASVLAALLSRGGPAGTVVANGIALSYLGYEMDFDMVTTNDAYHYFFTTDRTSISLEIPMSPLLFPLVAGLYGAGYAAPVVGQAIGRGLFRT